MDLQSFYKLYRFFFLVDITNHVRLEGINMIMTLGFVKIAVDFELKVLLQRLLKVFSTAKKKTHFIRLGERQSMLIPFLGLKDKNGRVIHFGDILKDNRNNLLTPVCEIENGEHILFFKPVQHLDKKLSIGCKSTYSNTLEVVGNIYLINFQSLKPQDRQLYH